MAPHSDRLHRGRKDITARPRRTGTNSERALQGGQPMIRRLIYDIQIAAVVAALGYAGAQFALWVTR
jgi:hypothetical protein